MNFEIVKKKKKEKKRRIKELRNRAGDKREFKEKCRFALTECNFGPTVVSTDRLA